MPENGPDLAVRVGIERGIERAVDIDPRDIVALRPIGRAIGLQRREHAAQNDLAVALQCHGDDLLVGARVEPGVERAVRVEPRDAMPVHGRGGAARQHLREDAAKDNLAIGLHHDGRGRRIGMGGKPAVNRPVSIEPGDTAGGRRDDP